MQPFILQFKDYIKEKNLFTDTSKLLVAISGGSDSVALAHLLKSLEYEIALVHCNFKLRGKDSDDDETFVKQFASNIKCKLHHISFDTKSVAQKNKISIEEAARILRYEWFEVIRLKTGYDFIVTGHHLDDLIETFFINLIAGTGIKGLKSIPPINNYVVRPLLFTDRNTLTDYCNYYNLNYRTDYSNFDTLFKRNKIRHQIIPLFKEINPGFNETMSRNIDIYNEYYNIYRDYIENTLKTVRYSSKGLVFINFEEVLKQKAPMTLLFEIISPYGFNSTQTRDMISNWTNLQTGKAFYSNEWRVIKHENQFILGPKKSEIKPIEIYENHVESCRISGLTLSFIEHKEPIDFSDKNIAYINSDKLRFPLLIRQVEKGDYFYPYGMKGKKKVSDFFTDLKLNTFEREQTLVLTTGNEIVWVLGQRIDDRFKIDRSCSKILQVIKN